MRAWPFLCVNYVLQYVNGHAALDCLNFNDFSVLSHNFVSNAWNFMKLTLNIYMIYDHGHTGQCKRTGGCYNELVVAFLRTGGGLKGKKIYTCWLYDLFISLRLFYLWWHLPHRLTVTMQFMALPSNWWFNSWFGLQIHHSSGVLPWKVFFSSKTA